MQRDSDEDAWRAIVENYGERAELDEDPSPRTPVDLPGPPDDLPEDLVEDQDLLSLRPSDPDPQMVPEDDEGFVPPPPPPLPRLPPDRLLAWAGLFGSPILLLVVVVLGVGLPPWVGYLLVASFVGGFGYLVVKMPRGPADPWDDGARL